MADVPTRLRGMTWNHTRGFVPLVAAAQRFTELHPEVEIHWERRSLHAFEAYPVERLAAEFDLIVIDHPFVGEAARRGPLLPLDEHLPAAFLADQAANSTGASHRSYACDGHQWALAIDAATPVSFWREDLLAEWGVAPPQDWSEVLELARLGRVEVPAAPINCLMNFYTFCLAEGETPFATATAVVARAAGRRALARLREVLELCDPGCWQRNPIGSHERVAATSSSVGYCPLAYGYSNYARRGYAAQRLTFGPPPALDGQPLRTTLGGTGLAVSALRPHHAQAAAFAQYAASAEVQCTLYTEAGGQPGYRRAWTDEMTNRLTHDTFRRTLPALDHAYLRPRYDGYVGFQEHGAPLVHRALRRELNDDEALEQLDTLYRHTLGGNGESR